MYSRIVVGTDGTDRSLIAVDHAARLAAAFAAELHVVAAASPIGARATTLSDSSARTAAKIGHDAGKRHGVRVIEHPRVGEPASVLMSVAEAIDADLIVVGSSRVTGHRRALAGSTGSVPSRLVHHCDRPLLIVHTG